MDVPVDPFFIWFLSEVVGPQLADLAVGQLKRGWESRLAANAIAAGGVSVSKRRLQRWLASDDVWHHLVRSQPDDAASLVESLEATIRRDRRQRGSSDVDLRDNAEALLNSILAQFLYELAPSLAVSVAHYREMWQLRDLGRGQAEIRRMLEDTGRFADVLAALPKPTASALRHGYGASNVSAARLAAYLTEASRLPRDLVAELWAEPPEWLTGGSHWLLLAVAEFASAHEVPSTARAIFEEMAERAAPDRPRWLARAALAAANAGDLPGANALIERAQELGERSHAFVEFCAALISEDPDTVLGAVSEELLESEVDRAMALLARAQAEDSAGRLDDALRTVDDLLAESAHVTAALLMEARFLAKRAMEGGGDSRFADLTKSKERGLAARDERRKWRGPSAEAAALAAEVAFSLGNVDEVLRIGLPRPDGEASDSEASSAALAGVTALAAIASGRRDIAQNLADLVEPGSQQSLIRGWLLEADGDEEGASREYRSAYELATDPVDRRRILVALARMGEWPLPDWDQLAASDPEQADELAALSEAARGLTDDAIRRLRRHAHSSRLSALLLSETYQEIGDVEAAVEVLREARNRFDDPTLLARAAVLLYPVDSVSAGDLAKQALAELPAESVDRGLMHRLQIQIGADDGDWHATETHARALIAAGDNEPTTRWALVMALYNQGRFEESWDVLNRAVALRAEDETQARLWIDLHRRFDRAPATVLRILDIAEGYQDSEQLVAEALMGIYTMGDAVELSEEAVSRLHAATFDFTDRFPESTIFNLIRADTVVGLVEQMRAHLSPGSEQFRTLVEQVWNGQLPYGFLSSFTGRPYVEALVRRAAGCLPAHDEASMVDETDAATAALDTRVVTDACALNVLSYVPAIWPDIRAAFMAVVVPRATILDAVAGREALSLRSTMTLGWDPATDSPHVFEITYEEASALFERAAWIAREALTLEVADGLRWQHLAEIDEERSGPWLAPVELAIQEGAPLYSDDIALRSLARSLGVRTFGTVALLKALVDAGRYLSEDIDELQIEFAQGFVVDLPLSDDAIRAIGDREEWRPGSLSFMTARPQFWKHPTEGLNRFLSLYRRAKDANPGTAPSWVYAASSGVGRAMSPTSSAGAVGELLAAVTVTTGLWDPDTFKNNLEAARAGLASSHEGDPLPRACAVLCQSLANTLGHAQGSQALLSLVAALDRDDRLMVLHTILRGCEAEAAPSPAD